MIRIATGMALGLAMLAAATDAKAPKVGEPAPDFTLKRVNGGTVSLGELRGQVVLLNFWATWCVPCRKELPLLDGYYKVARDSGLRVFAVTTEDSVPLGRLKALFNAMNIPAVRAVKGPYTVMTGVPTNYVIDRSGRVRHAKAGAFDLDELNGILVPLLNEPAPPAPATAS